MTPDEAQLSALVVRLHEQIAAALWLSGGMLAAALAIALAACGWRRAALAAGAGYGLTLCFVPVGHAQVLGPMVIAIALAGLALKR